MSWPRSLTGSARRCASSWWLCRATIDRLLKPTKEARYPAGKSATRPGATLRSSIVVRRAMDKMEQAPGFFEIDLVAHCGHSLGGERSWTLTATDVYLGLTVNIAIRNRSTPGSSPPWRRSPTGCRTRWLAGL